MGIALFARSSWLAPLQAAASRFVPAQTQMSAFAARPAPVAQDESARRALPRTAAANDAPAVAGPLARTNRAPRRPPSLRVVRNIEAGIPVGSSGRMVISGRMADVCAELDRLATLENTRRASTR